MNKFSLDNRTAIVTGGAQGFGLAMTERFLDSGASVIIWDLEKLAIEKAIKKLNNPKLSSVVIDVTNFDEISIEVEKVTKNKKIDIFINNAGLIILAPYLGLLFERCGLMEGQEFKDAIRDPLVGL